MLAACGWFVLCQHLHVLTVGAGFTGTARAYPSLTPGYRLCTCAYLTCHPARACRHDFPTTFLP